MFAKVFFFLPEQASTYASDVDNLALFILLVSAFFTVLIAFLVFYFGIRYRRKKGNEISGRTPGGMKLEIAWAIPPLVLGMVMFIWGTKVFFDIRRPPDNTLDIYVSGKQWMWKAQHPDGQMDGPNELHVPVNQPVRLIMISEDVIHSFYVPEFRVKQDVLPGRYTTLWFEATKPGTYNLFCAEYCGTEHSGMVGTVKVLKQDEYQRWLEERAQFSAAIRGEQLYRKLQCITCHGEGAKNVAPTLKGIFKQEVPLSNGQMVYADESYLRESIRIPNAKVVAGYRPNFMPAFADLKEEEIFALIAYIKSDLNLPRVEQEQPAEKKPE